MTEATKAPTLADLNKLISKRDAAQAVVKQLEEIIPGFEAQLKDALAAQQAREVVEVTGLAVGTTITFTYGRKDNRTERTGEVVAFAPAADTMPARYKVEVGSGFDIELLTVPARDVATPAPAVAADPLVEVAA